jgi:hypothetical protein
MGTCGTVSRIGSILTAFISQVVYSISPRLAICLYGATAAVAGFLCFLLPETKDRELEVRVGTDFTHFKRFNFHLSYLTRRLHRTSKNSNGWWITNAVYKESNDWSPLFCDFSGQDVLLLLFILLLKF